MREPLSNAVALSGVVRRPGSGRHRLTAKDVTLPDDQRRLLDPATTGDAIRPLPDTVGGHDFVDDEPGKAVPYGVTDIAANVGCELDPRADPKRIEVSDADMATRNIAGNAFQPEWNDTIVPRPPPATKSIWASPQATR